MGNPYIGEVRIFAGTFAPAGWHMCDGAALPISEYETLFQLIGTTYGGDGQETFNVPDLRGRLPVHQGPGFVLGELAGSETVTLNMQQIPIHRHPMQASSDISNSPNPDNSVIGRSPQVLEFLNAVPNTPMSSLIVGNDGGSQPHSNMQPFLCVNFIISLFGIFPSQN